MKIVAYLAIGYIRHIPKWYVRYDYRRLHFESPIGCDAVSSSIGVSDAEILEEVEQSELDAILDKISKSGYNALSKQEKKTLFELSKRKEP